ncbi:MAG: hypothetical protein GXP36_07765 [Actinobacteria bacterium]|nr:hypothetical protein [Actinomycetota bacterium]
MTDQTTTALRRTMATIVDVAPDAPELPAVPAAVSPARRWTPTLIAAAAFMVALILGVGTVMLIGLGDGEGVAPGSSGTGVTEFDPLTAETDVVAVFDAAAIELDPLLLPATVEQVAGLQGVSDVAVVSADDLGALLDLPVVPGPGIVVSTSGEPDVAEEVAMQLTDGTMDALVQVLFFAAVGEARVERAIDVLTRNAVPLVDGLLLATPSGPEPQFDTGPLGQEMLLDVTDDEEFLTELTASIPSRALLGEGFQNELAGTPVYLGHVGEVHGIVAPFRSDKGVLMICDIRSIGARTTGMGCNDLRDGGWVEDGVLNGRISIGATYSGDSSEPAAITFTALPEDVSVVAIELENGGDRYWQRPVGGSALFVVPGRSNISFTVTTFDSTGGIVTTEKRSLSP